jgi:hypothetical protein
MSENDPLLEENIQKLVQSGMGPDALPETSLRQNTMQRLLAIQAKNHPVDFPLPVLGGLASLLGGIGLWVVFQSSQGQTYLPAFYAGVLVIGINLAWIPLASATIVIFRRHHAK